MLIDFDSVPSETFMDATTVNLAVAGASLQGDPHFGSKEHIKGETER